LASKPLLPALNSFFDEVIDRIGIEREKMAPYSDMKVRNLPIHGSWEGEPLHESDDRITELWIGERAVATMVELRDGYNFGQVLLADYLDEELIEQIKRVIQRPRDKLIGSGERIELEPNDIRTGHNA
jgi:hypothetical protein